MDTENPERFKEFLSRTRSENTADIYETAAKRFEEFIESKGLTYETLPPQIIQHFVDSLVGEKLAPQSVHSYTRGAVRYLRWLARNTSITLPEIYMDEILLPRVIERIPQVLTDEELQTYFRLVQRAIEPAATALTILPLTGLRSAEVCHLRLTDWYVDPQRWVVFRVLNSKGKRDREVPMLQTGNERFRHYIVNVRSRILDGGDWLFPSRGGNPITTRTLRNWIRRIHAGVTKRFIMTPHTLRRTYATTLSRAGISDLRIAKLIGHESLGTTRKYVDVSVEDLTKSLSQLSAPKVTQGTSEEPSP